MSRSQRLLQLLQILRHHRHPVQAQKLAVELGIHVRTLYRDIATLKTQGAQIMGEPGVGYILRPGFTLPPLMFTRQEITALVLGSRWVAAKADTQLSLAAREALAKIAAVIPADLQVELDTTPLLIGPSQENCSHMDIAPLRQAINNELKIKIHYMDELKKPSSRTIWPVALGYFEHTRILIAWCELRQNFRHFRCDRITSVTYTQQQIPQRRMQLLQQWKKIQGIKP